MFLYSILLVFNILFPIGDALDAVSYFIKNKQVKSVQITNLNDSWVEYKYQFRNTNKKDLTNVNLNIGIIPHSDFKMFDCKMDNTSEDVVFSGYSVKILQMLQEKLKFKIKYVILKDNNSWIDALNSKQVDIIICHPGKKENILQLYDTINTKYVVVYKIGKMFKTNDIFVLTFVGSLWLVFLAILVLLAICLKISTSYYAEMGKTISKWNWVEITLWAIAAACQQGLSHCPERFASRCIFFLGYITSYLLYTGFAAGITSILVRQDLSTFDLKLIGNRNLKIYNYYCDETKIFDKWTIPVGSLPELLDALENRDSVGLVPELYIQQFFAVNFGHETAGSYILTSIPGMKYLSGFLLQPNSPWKSSLNSAVISLHQSGVLRILLERSARPILVPQMKSAYSSAGHEHVGSATYLYLTGVLAAIFLLLVEFLMAAYRNYRQRMDGHRQALIEAL